MAKHKTFPGARVEQRTALPEVLAKFYHRTDGAELFGGAPALLMGIEDPRSNAHAPNESLHEGDWKNLMRSLACLFGRLAELPGGKVK